MLPESYRKLTHFRYLLEAKTRHALRLFMNGGASRTVLFFPMRPHPRSAIYKMCLWAGCRITTNPLASPDAIVYWDFSTIRPRGQAVVNLHPLPVINANCIDVSKEHVDRTFAEVFGYDIRVDPRVHSGPCVRKSNENALHDVMIIACPIPNVETGYVYQRLIDSAVDNGLVEQIRVPVFGELIPLVYRKLRDERDRFANRALIAHCCETLEVLTAKEVRLILTFCRKLGLDYGELDVLRDRNEGRIYVVDANPTPWGPPLELAWHDQSSAMRAMARTFEETLLVKSSATAIRQKPATARDRTFEQFDARSMNLSEPKDERDSTTGQFTRPQGHAFEMEVTPYYLEHYAGNISATFTTALLANLLTSTRLFIDVGACDGFYSLLAATRHSHLEVVALEPVEEHYSALTRNRQRNDARNIRTLQKAAWNYNSEKVEPLTIDALLSDYASCPTLIRISAGGYELEVLDGMRDTLSRFPELSLVMELNPKMLALAGHTPGEFLERLRLCGFDAYFLDDHQRLAARAKDQQGWCQFVDPDGHITVYCPRQDRSMSICFFSLSTVLGGAERSLLELVTELIQDHGCICTVVVPAEGALSNALTRTGAACIYAPYRWWCDFVPVSEAEASRQIRDSIAVLFNGPLEIITNINPDIIMTFSMVIPWGALAAGIVGKPHVWHICEYGDRTYGTHFFFPFEEVLEFIRTSSIALLTNSKMLHHVLFPQVPENKCVTLYRHITIPPELPGEALESYYTTSRAVRLGVFGMLCEGKGQEDAVRAVAELIRKGHDVELLLAGPPLQEYHATLIRLIHECSVERHVRMPGFLQNVYAAMRQTDIVLICSRREAFGRVAVEAMLLGKPVIYPNTGGFLEYMSDGETGLAYSPGNWAQLAGRIETLLTRPELRNALETKGPVFAQQRFTRQEYGGKCFKALRELRGTTPALVSGRLLSAMLPSLTEQIRALQEVTKKLTRQREAQETTLEQRNEELAKIQAMLGWKILAGYWRDGGGRVPSRNRTPPDLRCTLQGPRLARHSAPPDEIDD